MSSRHSKVIPGFAVIMNQMVFQQLLQSYTFSGNTDNSNDNDNFYLEDENNNSYLEDEIARLTAKYEKDKNKLTLKALLKKQKALDMLTVNTQAPAQPQLTPPKLIEEKNPIYAEPCYNTELIKFSNQSVSCPDITSAHQPFELQSARMIVNDNTFTTVIAKPLTVYSHPTKYSQQISRPLPNNNRIITIFMKDKTEIYKGCQDNVQEFINDATQKSQLHVASVRDIQDPITQRATAAIAYIQKVKL